MPLSFNAFRSVYKQYDNREFTNEEFFAVFGPTEEEIVDSYRSNKPSVSDAIQDYYSYYEPEHHESQCEEHYPHIICVVTGKSRCFFDISTTAFQLESYFDVTIKGDDVVHPKPHPKGIHKALKLSL